MKEFCASCRKKLARKRVKLNIKRNREWKETKRRFMKAVKSELPLFLIGSPSVGKTEYISKFEGARHA